MAHSYKNNNSKSNTNPMYEQQSASASAANSSSAAAATTTSSAALTQQQQQQLVFAQEFWEEQILAAEQFDSDFKNHPLPLARIKKVMKSDPEVKMISAEAPILFSKACETFICEITRRAWLHAEENKRRTLQRSDVANAVSRSDQFDFLIDIVPREEPPKVTKRSSTREDPAPSAEAYDEQQQQQTYEEYYPQGAGGLAAYAHAIEAPSFYQSVSPEQFQQYMQYQQQAQSYQPSQQQPTGQTQQQAQSSQQQQSSRGGGHEPTSRQS